MSQIVVRDGERDSARVAPGPFGDAAAIGFPGAEAPFLPAERSITKRLFELIAALALTVLLLPVMVLIALLVRVDSPGPVLFRCQRVGHRGRMLQMLKFRKMHDQATGARLTAIGDHRLTRVGRWLARFKLDELPQLWHVVRGDMSLIGPRPEDHDFVAHFPRAYAEITRVRPGIMGLSQLAFAGESAILDPESPLDHYLERILPQKVVLDQLYATRWSLWLDVRIVLWTIVAVLLNRDVAVNRETGRMGLRRR